MNLSENTVLITGGGSGIGFAMAEAFVAAGSEVIICGRREQTLLDAHRKLRSLHVRRCNVASERDRRELVEDVLLHFPALNVLVNNAGVQREIDFTKGIDELQGGENELRVNLEAPIFLAGLLVPQLTGRSEAAIINVSSGLGFVPAARMPVYSASKAGLHAFTMALRRQVLPLGIKVFEVVPPVVDTGLNPVWRAAWGGLKANLSAVELVAAVMKGLAGDVPEIGYGMTEGFLRASSRS